MISDILYGRNYSYGYSLHKRGAISFNGIAEVLTHPDDEIIFADTNTPDDVPTFPEAIRDTLTPRARKLLRVLRCPRCELIQLGLAVDPQILFPPEYPYTSGTTKILRDNFADLSRECRALLSLESDDLAVDTGANDGTLLSNFAPHCRVQGIEPANVGNLANQRGIMSRHSPWESKTCSYFLPNWPVTRFACAAICPLHAAVACGPRSLGTSIT